MSEETKNQEISDAELEEVAGGNESTMGHNSLVEGEISKTNLDESSEDVDGDRAAPTIGPLSALNAC